MDSPQPFLPKKGNYKGLTAYQKAECIYDVTFYFANHFLAKGDRTVDQMVQAARSGKQNIAEGYIARLEKDFVEQGGIREQMTAARLGFRSSQKDEIARLMAENERLKQRIAWLEQQLANNSNGPQ